MRSESLRMLAIVAFLVFGGARLAQAGTFAYSLYDYPRTNQETCVQAAAHLGQLVAKYGNVQVISARCLQQLASVYDLQVIYEAEYILPVVTTSLRGNNTFGSGIYQSMAACQADLKRQIDAFTQNTGVKPIVHYCSKSNWSGGYPVSIRVEGFGEPEVKPFNFSKPLFGVSVDAPRAVASLTARATSLGFKLIGVAIAGSIQDSRIDILYYAAEPYNLYDNVAESFNNAAQCEARAKALEAAKPAAELLGAYCLSNSVDYVYELHLVTKFL